MPTARSARQHRSAHASPPRVQRRARRPIPAAGARAELDVAARGDTLDLMLQVRDLSVEVGGRLVVDHASFTVVAREKVGLVGRNGAGKTSLFRVLGGEVEPTLGRVIRKG